MKIAFLGDIALFGKFTTSKNSKDDVLRRLSLVKDALKEYDIVVANLETPLTESTKTCGGKSAYIKGIPEDTEILKCIGVTHVTLANNHVFDFKQKGFEDTLKALEATGIKYFGVNGIRCVENIGDDTVSLRGYCCYSTNARGFAENSYYGVNVLDYDATEKALKEDQDNNYLTVLSLHWGQEHVNYPNYYHMQFARNLAEKYDFLLHGHHPHVVQGVEKINNSFIAYSLGNFCFDDVYTKKSTLPLIKLSENNKTTFIWSVEIQNNKIIKSDYIPVYIGEEKLEITSEEIFNQKMKEYSEFLNTEKQKYIITRHNLLTSYLNSRKQMRDLNWYLKRMNLDSVKILVNAKKNSCMFEEHISNKLIDKKPLKIKKAVLFLGNFNILDLNAAGRRVLGVGDIFKELGYQPVFVGVNKAADSNVLNTLTVNNGYYVFSLKASLSTLDWIKVKKTYYDYLRVIDKVGLENISYIYIYGSPVLSFVISYIFKIAHKNNIPVIGDCVDWIESTGGGIVKNLVKYIDTNYQKRYLYNKTDGMIVISSYLEEYYANHKKKTALVPPVGDFKPTKYTLEERNYFRLVYAGIPFPTVAGIEKGKMKDRLDIIINIAVELNKKGTDTVLDIYGISKENYLISVPEHGGLLEDFADKIHFNGIKNNEEIKKEIISADATVLIRDETLVTKAGFPTKVAESLCLGTPVIANAVGDIDDYLKDGYNGLIVENEPNKAADRIIKDFINKKALIKANCLSDCPFDYKKYIDAMRKLLQDI